MTKQTKRVSRRHKRKLKKQLDEKLHRIEVIHNIITFFGFMFFVALVLGFLADSTGLLTIGFFGLIAAVGLFYYYLRKRKQLMHAAR